MADLFETAASIITDNAENNDTKFMQPLVLIEGGGLVFFAKKGENKVKILQIVSDTKLDDVLTVIGTVTLKHFEHVINELKANI